MSALLLDPSAWLALATLTALELVLGVDNILFIAILVERLPPAERERARRIGLFLAMFMRVGLLCVLSWLVGLTQPLFTLPGHALSGRDLILLTGGVFLLWKSTREIHELLEGGHEEGKPPTHARFGAILLQVVLIDLVFSLDSIITAVGMVDQLSLMIAAVVLSVGLMLWFAPAIGGFVSRHPTVKMLALSFLFVIGTVLVADGWGHHVPKGYVYSALAFSLLVEMLNLRLRQRRGAQVQLHDTGPDGR